MIDPVMISVANALATKAADVAAEGVRSAMSALIRLVRSRFAGDKAAAAALDAAQAAPQDQAAIEELARVLERASAADAGFAAQLRALWPELRAELSAGEGETVNSSTGTVGGHLIQARDLHVEGGLLLGDVQGHCP
jgi:hypothetical protein